jgi:hypothetical protein
MRAKFRCNSVTDFGYGSKEVKLSAVYSNEKNTEDNQFSTATPSGELRMMVSNPAAQDWFKPGKDYYLDFQEVPED